MEKTANSAVLADEWQTLAVFCIWHEVCGKRVETLKEWRNKSENREQATEELSAKNRRTENKQQKN